MSARRNQKAKTYYTPENVDRICQLIAETGLEGASADAVVSAASHHKWKQTKPEYKQRVDEALAEFNRKKFVEKTNAATIAQEYLINCLLGKQFEIEEIERIIENSNGIVTRHTETKRKQVRPPSWYLVRLLGDTTAKDFLIRVGLADPNNPEVTIEPSLADEEDDEQDEYAEFDSDA